MSLPQAMAAGRDRREQMRRILGCMLMASCLGLAEARAQIDKLEDIAVLQTTQHRSGRYAGTGPTTIWRVLHTVGSDLARTEAGALVPVEPLDPREGYRQVHGLAAKGDRRFKDAAEAGAERLDYPLRVAQAARLAPRPPEGWADPDFDDRDWSRSLAPQGEAYRSIAATHLRARFLVPDPAGVTAMELSATVQGGALFRLNGHEVGRVGLPAGALAPDAPALDYPGEAFFREDGVPLPQSERGESVSYPQKFAATQRDAAVQARYRQRFRSLTIALPTAKLRSDVNVLTVEVRRAPAPAAMFTRVFPKAMGIALHEHTRWWWNRCSLEDLKLTAKARGGAIVPNTGCPADVQLWNWPVTERVDSRYFGEPGGSCAPIRLRGPRHGMYSSGVLLSGPEAIRGLKARFVPAGGNPLPAAWVDLGFVTAFRGLGLDVVDDVPPAEITAPAMQPIVLTVNVPRGARAGQYQGRLTVGAREVAEQTVPVELTVGGWALPEPADYGICNAFIQSPDSVAIEYGVPMWSEAHWTLMERSFRVLSRLGCKEINIPLVRRAHFGNEHGMVWWVRQADGSLRPRLDIAERYIDLGIRRLGKIPVICFYLIEADEDNRAWVTVLDSVTGELENARAPEWGTPESRAFWRPVMEGLRQLLAERGLEASFSLGYHAAKGNGPVARKECIGDMKELAPSARWVRLGHYWFAGHDRLDRGPNGNPWARVAMVSGPYEIGWAPGRDAPFYGWRNPFRVLAYTRGQFRGNSLVEQYRLAPETVVLSGWRENTGAWAGRYDIASAFGRDTFPGIRGFGPWGADFWSNIIARYNRGQWDPRATWSTTQLNNGIVPHVIGKGATGPVPTLRSLSFHTGIQELEAHIFLQDTLDDPGRRAMLGDELAGNCRLLLDERINLLRYWGLLGGFDPHTMERNSWAMFEMAARVAATLGR